MQLDGINGASVKLTIDGYQFPSATPVDTRDWDANWLIVAGEVSTVHGDAWNFRSSSLATWEVHGLAAWLLNVSRCAVPAADETPSPEDVAGDWLGRLADAGWLTFTEPNLSFAVGRYSDQQVHLLVGLGYESAPR